MDRERKFLWMKDLLEHLGSCYEQWRHVEGGSAQFLADSMRRDMEEFRRLVDSLATGELRAQPALVRAR